MAEIKAQDKSQQKPHTHVKDNSHIKQYNTINITSNLVLKVYILKSSVVFSLSSDGKKIYQIFSNVDYNIYYFDEINQIVDDFLSFKRFERHKSSVLTF
jgi:hypothetical protein